MLKSRLRSLISLSRAPSSAVRAFYSAAELARCAGIRACRGSADAEARLPTPHDLRPARWSTTTPSTPDSQRPGSPPAPSSPTGSQSLALQPQHEPLRHRQTKIRTISGTTLDRRLHQLPFCQLSVGPAVVPPADEEPSGVVLGEEAGLLHRHRKRAPARDSPGRRPSLRALRGVDAGGEPERDLDTEEAHTQVTDLVSGRGQFLSM